VTNIINSKDTEKERDGGNKGEDNAQTANSGGTQLRSSREGQRHLHPRVDRTDAERQRRSNEVHQKHRVNLPTNHITGSQQPIRMHHYYCYCYFFDPREKRGLLLSLLEVGTG